MYIFYITGIWVHVEGYNTPVFDADGYVTACDNTGQFIGDVQRFLDAAQANNILVTLCLWNSAGMSNQNHINLILDDAKMESYFSNCLAVSTFVSIRISMIIFKSCSH